MSPQAASAGDNHVFLRGILAAEPQTRVLPSGDELCSFRLTVSRPPAQASRVRVDSIDCATTRARARKAAQRCPLGATVEVTGSLRRRFWRSAAGTPTSRYEVEVATVRKVSQSQW